VIWPDGSRAWFCDGARHRVGGPAVHRPDGTKEWWLDGDQIAFYNVYGHFER
jgi:hypothetical protein